MGDDRGGAGVSRIGNIAATWSLAEWRKGDREVARLPAHAQCTGEMPVTVGACTNGEWARTLRGAARFFGEWPHVRVGVWSLRQIAKNMGTAPTRVRELLRTRDEPK